MRLPVLLSVATCLSSPAFAQEASPAVFTASIEALTTAEKTRMTGLSWHEGCPVPLEDLVSVRLRYFGYDAATHDGVLVVHRRVAKEMVSAFAALYEARFPIEKMQPYEDFAVGKYADSNDTVGFYCRPAQDNPKVFSWHAYGLGIDINPMTNPYHDPRGWWPVGADGDRSRSSNGLINAQSGVVATFMKLGWQWGGMEDPPDYMHFGRVTVGDDDNPLRRQVWASELELAPQ